MADSDHVELSDECIRIVAELLLAMTEAEADAVEGGAE